MLTYGKPSREDGKKQRDDAKAQIRADEAKEKAKVRTRDGAHYCRLVPGCDHERHETAHLNDKGMGGDHGNRSTADQMLRSCWEHHRGNWSLHSNDLRVEFLSRDGANGAIQVWGRSVNGSWYLLGRETAVGCWERD